jgi:hypothetical protein
MRVVFVVFITLFLAFEGVAQVQTPSVIKGVVRDVTTGRPVENVNVFLSSTTVGVGTDHDGRFALKNIPAGRYTLIYSRVGYALKLVGVEFTHADTIVSNVWLAPKLIMFGDVEVSSEAAREFQKNLKLFSGIFFGEGPNAQHCGISNPEVLSFQSDAQTGMLVANADRPIVVINKALGYRLEISLAEFRWDTNLDFGSYLIYPQFRPLAVEGGIDSTVWKENRSKTYEGSFQHFLRALVAGTIESEGFVVFGGDLSDLQLGHGRHVFPDAIQPEILPGSALKRWMFDGWLRVDRKGDVDFHSSYIALDEFGAFIDQYGMLANPLSVRLLGRWSRERVASMLPLNE